MPIEASNNYKLLIEWLINPNQFFRKLNKFFANISGVKKTIFFLLSYLIPILCGLELYFIWTNFAIYTIADRIVPGWIVLVIFMGLSFILNLIFLLFLGPRGLKKGINSQLQQSSNEKALQNTSKQNKPELKILSRLYLLRNNLYFIPPLVILFGLCITNISRTWNIYLLGTYLTIATWIMILWTGYFALISLYSIGVEFPKINLPKISWKQIALRIAFALGLYFAFVIGLSIPLTMWLGAEKMPFWFKIAMFLMHGN
ncbi:MAG TPA: hypothetical protein VMV49_13400 [Candidatus Deferrimicrobium sp.]|nr:hypothetical protein [Candidatus Deferrimicrobium sp.]